MEAMVVDPTLLAEVEGEALAAPPLVVLEAHQPILVVVVEEVEAQLMLAAHHLQPLAVLEEPELLVPVVQAEQLAVLVPDRLVEEEVTAVQPRPVVLEAQGLT
jgi:hypothetical protein